jgi:flagellar motor switch protein FliM
MAMDEDGGEGRSNDDEEALMKEWAAMAGGDTGDGGSAPAGEESDAMAAEWEAMLGAGDGDGGGDAGGGEAPNSTRVLNQDESTPCWGSTTITAVATTSRASRPF